MTDWMQIKSQLVKILNILFLTILHKSYTTRYTITARIAGTLFAIDNSFLVHYFKKMYYLAVRQVF